MQCDLCGAIWNSARWSQPIEETQSPNRLVKVGSSFCITKSEGGKGLAKKTSLKQVNIGQTCQSGHGDSEMKLVMAALMPCNMAYVSISSLRTLVLRFDSFETSQANFIDYLHELECWESLQVGH